MLRRAVPILALALMLVATLGGANAGRRKADVIQDLDPAIGLEPPGARELVSQARDLWHDRQDVTGALAKLDAAVGAAPNDNDVRLERARYLEIFSKTAPPPASDTYKKSARADLERIVENDPDSLIAGVARDGLARLDGEPLLAPKLVSCPTSATKAHDRADAFYDAHQYLDAAVGYGRATAGCPDNAAWWVDVGDALLVLDDYERAKVNFVKALMIDPWNREAHRDLSDAYARLHDYDASGHELILAVVSDPTYESGWAALRATRTATGGRWGRFLGDRTVPRRTADGMAWFAYDTAKTVAREALGDSAPALDVEHEAVAAALKVASKRPGPFWSMMARARDDGFMDEAIFVHLLDASLAQEYPAFREKNAERLASYVETLIAR